MKVTLPINIQRDYNSFLFLALPLCVLLSIDTYKSWYLENYINLLFIIYKDKGIDLGFEDFILYNSIDSLNSNIFDSYKYQLDDTCNMDILQNIKIHLNDGFYTIIFLDEYYITDRSSSNNKHFVHEFLIYGYDDDRSVFQGIAFRKDKSFGKLELTYVDLETAFKSAKTYVQNRLEAPWIKEKIIMFFRLHKRYNNYTINMSKFFTKMNNYYIGKLQIDELFFSNLNFEQIDSYFSGINITDGFIEHLNSLIEKVKFNQDIDLLKLYKFFHLLDEYKKGIYLRLKYFYSLFPDMDSSEQKMCEYKILVDLCTECRMLYMKGVISSKDITDKLVQIQNKLITVKKNELILFPTFLEDIEKMTKYEQDFNYEE